MVYIFGLAVLIGLVALFSTQRPNSSGHIEQIRRQGSLASYFAQITQMQVQGTESYFVTAMASDKTHFIQVSVGRGDETWVYQFDMPITAWSEQYAATIEDEARARGFAPVRVEGISGMDFLDIDFSDRAAHDTFVIWVVQDVFGLPQDETFEVTWG